MEPWMLVAIIVPSLCAGGIAFGWVITSASDTLGLIVVLGGESLYLNEESVATFLGDWCCRISQNRAKILLVNGTTIRQLKKQDLDRSLRPEERALVTRWRTSSGRQICVLRNNNLADQASKLIAQQKTIAEYFRAHPELTTSLERSDKNTFVSGI